MRVRVAITGVGVVSPLGNSMPDLMSALHRGQSGIRRLPTLPHQPLSTPIGATVETPDYPGAADQNRVRMLDRVSQLALAATDQAVVDSGLQFSSENPERCGVAVGSGMGGAATTEEGYHTLYARSSDRIKPFTVIAAMTNAPAAWIGLQYALLGPNLTYSTACSSATVALGEAADRIRAGHVDVMLAGGTEAPLTPGVLSAWTAMRTLASADRSDIGASCRPFAATRTGLVLGEGAAFCVLESWEHALRRGASIKAELTGYGLTTDAQHLTRPSVAGQSRAMRAALESAGRTAAEIDYINAHGTATLQNDAVETLAIKDVFGPGAYAIPVSSTKSMHGHLLGAAGALEAAICVGCMERRFVPPTMHLDRPDPACDLDYVAGQARDDVSLSVVMTNSFAFGGTNAVLILEKPQR